jgi:tetratricopeptide (TPR) repeat protein
MAVLEEDTFTAVSGGLGPLATATSTATRSTFAGAWQTTGALASGPMPRASGVSDKAFSASRECAAYTGLASLRLRGALTDVALEAASACTELRPYDVSATAEAFYELGEIRLRLGDLQAAEEAFRQAHELGRAPQPGLALLRLSEGNVKAASTAIRSALSDESSDRLARSQLLPAQVEIALAAADLDVAGAATDELEAIAAVYGTPAMQAAALRARGQLQLSLGDDAGALRSLRAGFRRWQELDAPYETSRSRMALAAAYRAAGDLETAALELAAARSTRATPTRARSPSSSTIRMRLARCRRRPAGPCRTGRAEFGLNPAPAPGMGFSRAMRRIKVRIARSIGRRPGEQSRDFQRQ